MWRTRNIYAVKTTGRRCAGQMQIEQGNNLLRIKATNQSAILKMIYYFGPIKRAEIAKRLDLTLPTITTNVNNMISEGIVRETGAHGPDYIGFGRKARLLEIVPKARHFIGVEITGRRRSISIVDYSGHEIYSYSDGRFCADYDKNMMETCKIISDCLEQCQLSWGDIHGVCLVLPGVVDTEEGILRVHPRNQWNNKNIRGDFQRLTGYGGMVVVENNTCARALGVRLYRREVFENVRSFVYLFVDVGIACPLIVIGPGYVGSVVGTGEIGHMVMERGGVKCSCGNRGCLEAYSSDHAIIGRCVEALSQGKAEILGKICAGSVPPTIAQILEAQKSGDEDVRGIVENAITILGVAVANIINFSGPDAILIDCKLFGEEDNRTLLLDTANMNLCNKTYRGTEFVFVEPDKGSGAKGAAAVVINKSLE